MFGSIDNPGVAIWAAPGGEPHHYEVMGQAGIGNFIACEISPSGEVTTLFGDPTAADDVAAKDPRLHAAPRDSDTWAFKGAHSFPEGVFNSEEGQPTGTSLRTPQNMHDWEPGTYGKGFVLNDGTPVTWTTVDPRLEPDHLAVEQYGPHHTEVAADMGLGEWPEGDYDKSLPGDSQGGWHTPVYIAPDGTVEQMNYWAGADESGMGAFDNLPGLKLAEPDEWHFGKLAGAEHFEPYQHGGSFDYDHYEGGQPGKGFILPDGRPVTWNVSGYGEPGDRFFAGAGPHHQEVAMYMGLDRMPDTTDELKAEDRADMEAEGLSYEEPEPTWHSPISIDSQGNYKYLNWNDNFRKEGEDTYGSIGLRPHADSGAWTFSKTAVQKYEPIVAPGRWYGRNAPVIRVDGRDHWHSDPDEFYHAAVAKEHNLTPEQIKRAWFGRVDDNTPTAAKTVRWVAIPELADDEEKWIYDETGQRVQNENKLWQQYGPENWNFSKTTALYHVGWAEDEPSVMSQGLQPADPGAVVPETDEPHPAGVYMYRSLRDAQALAASREEPTVIYEIDDRGLKLSPDPTMTTGAVVSLEPIPPHRLRKVAAPFEQPWHVVQSDFDPNDTFYPASAGNPDRSDQRVVITHKPTREIFVGKPGTHHGDLIHHHGLDYETISNMDRDERQYYEPVEDSPYTWTKDEGADFPSMHYGWISQDGGFGGLGRAPEGVTEALHRRGYLQQPDGSVHRNIDDNGDWHFAATHPGYKFIIARGKLYMLPMPTWHDSVHELHGMDYDQEEALGVITPNNEIEFWANRLPPGVSEQIIKQQIPEAHEIEGYNWGETVAHIASEYPMIKSDDDELVPIKPWQQGQIGKAYIHDNQVIHWATQDDMPHHQEVAGFFGHHLHSPVYIEPDGTIVDYGTTSKQNLNQIAKAIGGAVVPREKWNFARVAKACPDCGGRMRRCFDHRGVGFYCDNCGGRDRIDGVQISNDTAALAKVAAIDPWQWPVSALERQRAANEELLGSDAKYFDPWQPGQHFGGARRATRSEEWTFPYPKRHGGQETATHTAAQVMYHAAPSVERAAIQQHGLIPNAPEGGWPSGVYLFHDQDNALFFAGHMGDRERDMYGAQASGYDVWMVDTAGLELLPDPAVTGDDEFQREYPTQPLGASYTPNAVEPSRLRLAGHQASWVRLDWHFGATSARRFAADERDDQTEHERGQQHVRRDRTDARAAAGGTREQATSVGQGAGGDHSSGSGEPRTEQLGVGQPLGRDAAQQANLTQATLTRHTRSQTAPQVDTPPHDETPANIGPSHSLFSPLSAGRDSGACVREEMKAFIASLSPLASTLRPRDTKDDPTYCLAPSSPQKGLERRASKPTAPPNYRKGDGSHHCGACKMYWQGKCWGYGNRPVGQEMVCDSFSPERSSHAIPSTQQPQRQGRPSLKEFLVSGSIREAFDFPDSKFEKLYHNSAAGHGDWDGVPLAYDQGRTLWGDPGTDLDHDDILPYVTRPGEPFHEGHQRGRIRAIDPDKLHIEWYDGPVQPSAAAALSQATGYPVEEISGDNDWRFGNRGPSMELTAKVPARFSNWDVQESDVRPEDSYKADMAHVFTHSPWVADPAKGEIYIGPVGTHHWDMMQRYHPGKSLADVPWGTINHGMIHGGQNVTPEMGEAIRQQTGLDLGEGFESDDWHFGSSAGPGPEGSQMVTPPGFMPWKPDEMAKAFKRDGTWYAWSTGMNNSNFQGTHHEDAADAMGFFFKPSEVRDYGRYDDYDYWHPEHGWRRNQPEGEWHFGGYETPELQPWNPGDWGKGYWDLDDDKIHTWKTDEIDGRPAHAEVMGDKINAPVNTRGHVYFRLHPDSQFEIYYPQHAQFSDELSQRLGLPIKNEESYWAFEGKTAAIPPPSEWIAPKGYEPWQPGSWGKGATAYNGFWAWATHEGHPHHAQVAGWDGNPIKRGEFFVIHPDGKLTDVLDGDPEWRFANRGPRGIRTAEGGQLPEIIELNHDQIREPTQHDWSQDWDMETRRPFVWHRDDNQVVIGPPGTYHSQIDPNHHATGRGAIFVGNEWPDSVNGWGQVPEPIIQHIKDHFGYGDAPDAEWHFGSVDWQVREYPEYKPNLGAPYQARPWIAEWDNKTIHLGQPGWYHADLLTHPERDSPMKGARGLLLKGTIRHYDTPGPGVNEALRAWGAQSVQPANEWHFGATPPGLVDWVPGTLGKGLYHPDYGVHVFHAHSGNHYKVNSELGWPNDSLKFRILPDGSVSDWLGGTALDAETVNKLRAQDPRLKEYSDPRDAWKFGGQEGHILNWQPGQPGKGLYFKSYGEDPEFHTWNTTPEFEDDMDGRPWHSEYLRNTFGRSNMPYQPFHIHEDGTIFTQDPYMQSLQMYDPNIKLQNYGWKFGATDFPEVPDYTKHWQGIKTKSEGWHVWPYADDETHHPDAGLAHAVYMHRYNIPFEEAQAFAHYTPHPNRTLPGSWTDYTDKYYDDYRDIYNGIKNHPEQWTFGKVLAGLQNHSADATDMQPPEIVHIPLKPYDALDDWKGRQTFIYHPHNNRLYLGEEGEHHGGIRSSPLYEPPEVGSYSDSPDETRPLYGWIEGSMPGWNGGNANINTWSDQPIPPHVLQALRENVSPNIQLPDDVWRFGKLADAADGEGYGWGLSEPQAHLHFPEGFDPNERPTTRIPFVWTIPHNGDDESHVYFGYPGSHHDDILHPGGQVYNGGPVVDEMHPGLYDRALYRKPGEPGKEWIAGYGSVKPLSYRTGDPLDTQTGLEFYDVPEPQTMGTVADAITAHEPFQLPSQPGFKNRPRMDRPWHEDWHFGKTAGGHQLNFVKGKPGKGLMDKNGVLHTWNIDGGMDGWPSHADYIAENDIPLPLRSAVYITPHGTLSGPVPEYPEYWQGHGYPLEQSMYFGSTDSVQNGGHVFKRYLGQNLPEPKTTAPWELGRWGKGALLDGKLHLWATKTADHDYPPDWFDPHHDGIYDLVHPDEPTWGNEGYGNMPKFYVRPTGEIESMRQSTPAEAPEGGIEEQIAAMHPDLKLPGAAQTWNFAKTADDYDEDGWEDEFDRQLKDKMANPPSDEAILDLLDQGVPLGEVGKMLKFDDGFVAAWVPDEHGSPHHDDVIRALGREGEAAKYLYVMEDGSTHDLSETPYEWNF